MYSVEALFLMFFVGMACGVALSLASEWVSEKIAKRRREIAKRTADEYERTRGEVQTAALIASARFVQSLNSPEIDDHLTAQGKMKGYWSMCAECDLSIPETGQRCPIHIQAPCACGHDWRFHRVNSADCKVCACVNYSYGGSK